MFRSIAKWAMRLLILFVVFLFSIGGLLVAWNLGWLSPLGLRSESHDSQVIQAIERTQEVSLVGLGIQGIREEDRCSEAFGNCIPGTGETLFLQYNFTAKLGINGADVQVEKTGQDAYLISVPKFISIGFADPTFKVATEDSGVLSWVTPDIDEVEMVNEILNDDSEQQYIDSNDDLLKDQTKVFYDSLITSIDPGVSTTYEFDS
jgi:hypothetical protein